MIYFAVPLICSALVLYTIAIWSERLSHGLKLWMIVLFSLAFSCDLAGTSLMFCLAEIKFQFCLHSLAGYLALLIMGLHLAWAWQAFRQRGRREELFHRFSIFAWLLWLLAFLSGVPRI